MKRFFDVVLSFLGLLVLFVPLIVVALLIKLDSPGPVLFRQKRIGKGFRPFFIYKFRTMVEDAPRSGPVITLGADPRITRVGRLLRKSKLDEVPQLLNVLKGDMSFVGPRPEIPQYVEMFRKDYEQILIVRPGITDLASLKYRDEAALLQNYPDPEAAYRKVILPDKIELAKQYLRRSSILFDLQLMIRTLLKLAV